MNATEEAEETFYIGGVKFSVEDLPPTLAELVPVIGMDNLFKLIEWGAGGQIYFPSLKVLQTRAQQKAILKDFDSSNGDIQAIARRHKVSHVWVYTLVKKQRQERRAG